MATTNPFPFELPGGVYRWRKGDPDGVRRLPRSGTFVSIDPGRHGAIRVQCEADGFVMPLALSAAISTGRIGLCETLIIEDVFASPNVQTLVDMARWGGFVLGWLARLAQAERVVLVPAASWQSEILGRVGNTAMRKRRAMEVAGRALADDPTYTAARKADREGMADAWCIGEWWLHGGKTMRIG